MQKSIPEEKLDTKIEEFNARICELQETRLKIQSYQESITQLHDILDELETREVSILGRSNLPFGNLIKMDIINLYNKKIAEHRESIKELLDEI